MTTLKPQAARGGHEDATRSTHACVLPMLLLAGAALLTGCPDGSAAGTPDGVVGADTFAANDFGDATAPDGTPLPECRPNRDGVLEADEIVPAIGVPVIYGVTTGNASSPVSVDVAGTSGPGGLRWDFGDARPREQTLEIAAANTEGRWFEDLVPPDAFVVPFDIAGETEAVYRHTGDALWLVGIFSREESPDAGRTQLVYDEPVALYRFPLRAGDEHVSVGTVRNGEVRGLPYAGRDTYVVEVDGEGELETEFLTFDQALRVRTHVTVQPSVGQSASRRQVSWLFECFGEVARATSLDGETEDDFTAASEFRRISLE